MSCQPLVSSDAELQTKDLCLQHSAEKPLDSRKLEDSASRQLQVADMLKSDVAMRTSIDKG